MIHSTKKSLNWWSTTKLNSRETLSNLCKVEMSMAETIPNCSSESIHRPYMHHTKYIPFLYNQSSCVQIDFLNLVLPTAVDRLWSTFFPFLGLLLDADHFAFVYSANYVLGRDIYSGERMIVIAILITLEEVHASSKWWGKFPESMT